MGESESAMLSRPRLDSVDNSRTRAPVRFYLEGKRPFLPSFGPVRRYAPSKIRHRLRLLPTHDRLSREYGCRLTARIPKPFRAPLLARKNGQLYRSSRDATARTCHR